MYIQQQQQQRSVQILLLSFPLMVGHNRFDENAQRGVKQYYNVYNLTITTESGLRRYRITY